MARNFPLIILPGIGKKLLATTFPQSFPQVSCSIENSVSIENLQHT